MPGFVIYETAGGKARSFTTALPDPIPNGLSSQAVTEPDWTDLRSGALMWDEVSKTLIPSGRPTEAQLATQAANAVTIKSNVAAALTAMQAIIDTPAPQFGNIAGARAAIQDLQSQVKDEARVLRRLIRLVADQLDGTD